MERKMAHVSRAHMELIQLLRRLLQTKVRQMKFDGSMRRNSRGFLPTAPPLPAP
jgi:hypothetical protein